MDDFPALTLAQSEKVNRILGLGSYELLQEARKYAGELELKPLPFEDTAYMLTCLALANKNLSDLFPNRPPMKEGARGSLSNYLISRYVGVIPYENGGRIDAETAINEMDRSFWTGLEQTISYLVDSNRSFGALKRILGHPEDNLLPGSAEKIFLDRVRNAFVEQFGPPREFNPRPPYGGKVIQLHRR